METARDLETGHIGNVESSPSATTKEAPPEVRADSGVASLSETGSRKRRTTAEPWTSPGEVSAPEAAGQRHGDTRVQMDTVRLEAGGSKDAVGAEVTEQPTPEGGIGERSAEGEDRGPMGNAMDECPVCTDPYESRGTRGRALLNCDHSVCRGCLNDMLKRAADGSRVCCPLCRQKTPLLSWEIRQMQEEAVSLMGTSYSGFGPTPAPGPSLAATPPPAEPGSWAALERRLDSRIDTASLCGCFRYPPGLVRRIRRLRYRCRCCYSAGLLLLYLVEISCLLLVFLPVIVLVLLFTLANK